MFVLALVAAFFVCAHGASLPPVPMLDGKIVGGSAITINSAPYQIAMLYGGSQSCGGSIIASNRIVTAAHCTSGTSASVWSVRAGSSFHNSGGTVVSVSSFTQHASYSSSTLNNDICILRLSSSLSLGSTIATVTLPAQGATVADGASSYVTGWGLLSEGGSRPTQLYAVTIPIVNQAQCVSAYSGFNTVTTNMICAGRLGVGGQDACQGDSGGPLTVGGVLHGITSWGRGCAQANYPGVWTRVANYRTWITNNS